MNALVSVIVPVYNAQRWLKKCIESILNQSYVFLEVLLIDDGSTDNSLNICKEYALRDKRIRIIQQKNGGVSCARNQGIKYSTGELIIFVDSDDYLSEDIIEIASNRILSSNTDLCVWNFSIIKDDIEYPEKAIYIKQCTHDEMLCSCISLGECKGKYNLGWGMRPVWGKIFRAETIKNNNLRFSEKMYIGEDAIFMFKYLNCINSIVVLNNYGYFYREVSNSACHRYKDDLFNQSILQINEFLMLRDSIEDLSLRNCAITVLCWRIFCDLVVNDSKREKKHDYSDAQRWFSSQKKWMMGRCLSRYVFGKTRIKIFFRWLPKKILCRMIAMYHSKNV